MTNSIPDMIQVRTLSRYIIPKEIYGEVIESLQKAEAEICEFHGIAKVGGATATWGPGDTEPVPELMKFPSEQSTPMAEAIPVTREHPAKIYADQRQAEVERWKTSLTEEQLVEATKQYWDYVPDEEPENDEELTWDQLDEYYRLQYIHEMRFWAHFIAPPGFILHDATKPYLPPNYKVDNFATQSERAALPVSHLENEKHYEAVLALTSLSTYPIIEFVQKYKLMTDQLVQDRIDRDLDYWRGYLTSALREEQCS